MRQNWIEFEIKDDRFLSLRPEYITKYSMVQEGTPDVTIVMYEEGDFTKDYYVNEPYEQVKQKIMDAEKVDLSGVAVERFTKEEYRLLNTTLFELIWGDVTRLDSQEVELTALHKKLQSILKEMG